MNSQLRAISDYFSTIFVSKPITNASNRSNLPRINRNIFENSSPKNVEKYASIATELSNMAEEIAEAARILSRAAERLNATALQNESSPSSSQTSQSVTTPVARVERELSTLFGHKFSSSSGETGRWRKNNRKAKRAVSDSAVPSKRSKVLEKKFVCLADKEQTETPDSEEQRELLMAGLGEEKIRIPEDSNEMEIRRMISEKFPKLHSAGGFDLMYAEPRKRFLHLIPPGPNGLTMKFLSTFIAQGKVFVRPIQEDLSMETSPPVQTSGQKEKCKRCQAMLNVYELRDHYATCSNVNSTFL